MDRLTGIIDQFRGKFGGLNDLNSPQRAECEMASGTIIQQVVQEIKQVNIPINQDFFYIDAKTGYHLISAMFTSSWGGRWDTIIGIAWTGYNYALFLHAPYTASARTENVILVWVKNN